VLPVGLEQVRQPSDFECLPKCAAQIEAVAPDSDPELVAVVDAWPKLTAATRNAILRLVAPP
jgi:hypothetical protein